VALTSKHDTVAGLASAEAESGARLAGAAYVAVSVDRDGREMSNLTRALGHLPTAPATLVYQRPSTLYVTLPGFNDRTAVQQAAASAALGAAASLASAAAGAGTSVGAPAATWSSQTLALCRQAARSLGPLGGSNPVQLAARKVQFEAASTSFLARMKALRPAASQRAQVTKLNALLARRFAALDAAVAAFGRHDIGALAAAKVRLDNLDLQVNALERELGVGGCTELAA
jgi:hypothetical protein